MGLLRKIEPNAINLKSNVYGLFSVVVVVARIGGCGLLTTPTISEMSITMVAITTTTRTMKMASRSDPILSDRVTKLGEISNSRIEGENDPRSSVNIIVDRSKRTLLAWQGLMVMPCFMLPPYVTNVIIHKS